ncbi:hypothetical protein SAMN04487977_10239 [Treponema bryantii]|uniref:Phosphopantetheine attachment site n=1 Tax=Treponema bryantii TaxID=163 RepID=A0A1H9C492_9SPIR|nr:hypothetical protein [Treponema bryantii]SEP95914.1 hypothetical protein SAMN04487977_10239 [Treponema bryantii]
MITKKEIIDFITIKIQENIPPEYHNLINEDFNMANNELGFNSVNYVMLVYDLETKYGISLEESLLDLTQFNTISILADFLTQLINKD